MLGVVEEKRTTGRAAPVQNPVIQQFQDATAAALSAEGLDAQIAAFNDLRRIIIDAAGGMDNLTLSQSEFLAKIEQTEAALRRQKAVQTPPQLPGANTPEEAKALADRERALATTREEIAENTRAAALQRQIALYGEDSAAAALARLQSDRDVYEAQKKQSGIAGPLKDQAMAAWDDLVHAAHERAFVVAGAMKADLLADLGNAVERAIGEHRSLDKFRTEFRQIVADRGWHGWTGEGTAKGEAWRTKVIYKTNMATSYAAGRMAQLVKTGYKFWVYKHGNALEPRLQHLAWDGVALPPDHPFWATHAPPNGWGCTCRVTGADSAAGIRRAGGDPDKTLPDGWQAINPKTGTPAGIDKGWDYKVGGSVADEVNAFVAQKAAKLPEPLRQDLTDAVKIPAKGLSTAEMRTVLEDIFDPSWLSHIEIGTRASVRGPLDLAEVMAIHAFSIADYDGYGELNAALRGVGGATPSAAQAAWIKMLDAALAKLPVHRGLVHRGLDMRPGPELDRFEALLPGQALKFRAYSSSSLEAESALAGNVVLRVISRTGRRIDQLAAMAEKEVLLGHDTVYVVRKREVEGDTLILWLDEVAEASVTGLKVELMHALSLE